MKKDPHKLSIEKYKIISFIFNTKFSFNFLKNVK